MAIKIPIDIPVNDSKLLKAKKALEELYKLAEKSKKQTMNAPSGVSPTSPLGKPSRASTILEKAMNDLAKAYKKEKQVMEKQGKARYAWEKTKFVGGKVGRFAGAAAEGFHTGASLSSRITSGHGEFTSGGFMNTAHDKISAAQDMYAKTKEGYGSIRDAYKGQKEERDEHGNITQAGRKGGIAAATVSAIPVVGGVIGAVLGGVLNQINDMGKEYTSTMRTQQGTIGATGGYVGGVGKNEKGELRGNPYFANAQMAQAQISMRRTQSQFGFGKGSNVSGQDVKFAAQQNIGIAQYAEQLGQLKENDKSVSTDFLRGAADINKMTGLKQGQFVQKLASYSNSLKEAGFSQKGIKQFASVTAGLAKTGMTGERAMTVGQNIDQDMRKGIGGGALSKMAVSGLMDQGYSLHEARKIISKGGITDERVRNALNPTLEGLDEETRTHLMEKEGWGNYGELSSVSKITAPKILGSKKGIIAGSNEQLGMENARASIITRRGGIGEKSANLSHKMGMDSLQLFEDLNKDGGMLGKVIDALGQIETETFKGIKVSIDKTNEYMKAFQDGNLMKKMGKDFKEGFGSIFSN